MFVLTTVTLIVSVSLPNSLSTTTNLNIKTPSSLGAVNVVVASSGVLSVTLVPDSCDHW